MSELLNCARNEGPQIITRHGLERAVVISIEEYHRISAPDRGKDLKALLLGGPKLSDDDVEMIFN